VDKRGPSNEQHLGIAGWALEVARTATPAESRRQSRVADFYVRWAARTKDGGRGKETHSIDEDSMPSDKPSA
jgi:hypothetical protein